MWQLWVMEGRHELSLEVVVPTPFFIHHDGDGIERGQHPDVGGSSCEQRGKCNRRFAEKIWGSRYNRRVSFLPARKANVSRGDAGGN